jgi:urease accessory protein
VLSDLYQRAPCRVLFPQPEVGELAQAVLLTTSGGLTGGDRTRLELDVQADARATLTTQAAEKLYRALPHEGDTEILVEITVAARAWAEWLAQETILFNGARLRRELCVDIAAGGRLLALESLVFGRTAMRESFDTGFVHDAWRIRRGGRLIWADALHLYAPARLAPFGFGTAVACSTLVYVGDDAGAQLAGVRRLLVEHCATAVPGGPAVGAVSGGATSFDGLLLVRLLATDAAELRVLVMALAAHLREAAAGLPPRVPRVWHC